MILNGGQQVAFGTPASGLYPQDYLSLPGYATGDYPTGPSATGSAPQANSVAPVQYLYWIVGFIVFLVILKFAVEHEKAEFDIGDMRIGVYNILATTMMAGLGFFVAKTVANKYAVPTPLKNIINTV